jgi:hypothetical protein
MVLSGWTTWHVLADLFERQYEDAVVYGDAAEESVLHEGEVRVCANGWVELPTGRLLSPEAVHHIDRVER